MTWGFACDRCWTWAPPRITHDHGRSYELRPDGWRTWRDEAGELRDACPGCLTAEDQADDLLLSIENAHAEGQLGPVEDSP